MYFHDLIRLIRICYKTKTSPKNAFRQFKNTMPTSRYSFTRKYTDEEQDELYNEFIIYDVVPYFTNNIKLFQYIFNSIKPIIINDIDRVVYFIYKYDNEKNKEFNYNQLYQVIVLIKTLTKNKMEFWNVFANTFHLGYPSFHHKYIYQCGCGYKSKYFLSTSLRNTLFI